MQVIREKISDIKTSLEALEERMIEKPICNSMAGKRFLYRLREIRRDIASTEKLLDKLEAIDKKYAEAG